MDDTVDHGTLKVENTKVVRSATHAVFHHDELDWLLVFHTNTVNSIYTGKETVFTATDAGKISFLKSLKSFEIVLSHRLDDEFLVLREEEEATRLSL